MTNAEKEQAATVIRNRMVEILPGPLALRWCSLELPRQQEITAKMADALIAIVTEAIAARAVGEARAT